MDALIACIVIVVVALVIIKVLGIFSASIDARLAQAITYVVCGIALIALIRVLFPLLGHGRLF